jgi:hypothetical protein
MGVIALDTFLMMSDMEEIMEERGINFKSVPKEVKKCLLEELMYDTYEPYRRGVIYSDFYGDIFEICHERGLLEKDKINTLKLVLELVKEYCGPSIIEEILDSDSECDPIHPFTNDMMFTWM